VAYVNHFKVVLLLCVISIDSASGYFLGNVEEYPGRGIVIGGESVERISVWAWLYGVMVQ